VEEGRRRKRDGKAGTAGKRPHNKHQTREEVRGIEKQRSQPPTLLHI
jgi:hypothetical protein